ncbi:hypothetical protein VNO77_03914 [Canavalia gladiata]|uniref:Uncharacterized protein n=1 Tax=Canavalia gladiata TaxID=3824 RepID=A0AAN9MVP9_CANGL
MNCGRSGIEGTSYALELSGAATSIDYFRSVGGEGSILGVSSPCGYSKIGNHEERSHGGIEAWPGVIADVNPPILLFVFMEELYLRG